MEAHGRRHVDCAVYASLGLAELDMLPNLGVLLYSYAYVYILQPILQHIQVQTQVLICDAPPQPSKQAWHVRWWLEEIGASVGY